jgi:DNA-binding transcriptional LysR family regulator
VGAACVRRELLCCQYIARVRKCLGPVRKRPAGVIEMQMRKRLTEAGSLALTHAREVVRHLTLMRTEVVALAGEITGTLSLASLPSVTATLVAPQLRVFAERHPAVTIRLLEGSEEEVRDWLDQGAAEAGVVSLPVKGLDTAVLGDQDMVAVVPADDRLAGWNEVG